MKVIAAKKLFMKSCFDKIKTIELGMESLCEKNNLSC